MSHARICLCLAAVLAMSGLISCRATGPDADTLYGQRIVVGGDGGASLTNSANELSHWLERSTGAKFEVVTAATNSAIFLLRTNSALLAATDLARLEEKGREAFVIRSEGGEKLWIVGNSDMALRHGVYFYLDQLGCRWFLPNDHWTIIPSRKSIGLEIDRVEAPAFRLRNFFGTGGFGRSLPVDSKQDDQRLQAQWEQWKARNRLGGEIALAGHSYEGFNLSHKAELIAHPEYLAEIGGKRQPWGMITKPCVSNPGVRKLFIDDRLAALKRVVEKSPDSPRAFAVSVEPSDGGGHCQCAACLKIGSVSDRVFFLANEVAKAVAEKYPGTHVNLLAYNEHAAVPSIALEPNVFVAVVPYGFQRTGLPGDELVEAWAKKCRKLGMYDYWAIPDWANCLPVLSFRTTVPRKIRFWYEHSVDAFHSESSFSAGNVGVVWYVASRLLWNPGADVDVLLDDFYAQSFGPAAPPMKRMLERWGSGFVLTKQEIALSFRDVQEAHSLATDDATRARVGDFVLYVEYLRLWYEYKHSRDHAQATRALLEFIWRIYDSAMVHTFRMHQLIVNRYEKGEQSLVDAWPMKNPKADAWTNLKPVTSEEVGRIIAAGVKNYTPLEYEERTYSRKLVPLTPGAKAGREWMTSPSMVGGMEFAFWADKGVSKVAFQLRCGPRKSPSDAPYDRVTILDPNGKTILRESVEPDGGWHTLTVPTPMEGVYRVSVHDQKLTFALQTPGDVPFVVLGGFTCPNLSTPVYFYVPRGMKRIALCAESAIAVEIRDGAGRKVGEDANGFIVKDVPEGQDGKVWSLRGYKGYTPLRPVNFPAAFSFSSATLLVPGEVAPAQ